MKNPKYLTLKQYQSIFKKNEGYFISEGIIESAHIFHFLCNEINPENRVDFNEEIEPFDSAYWNAIVTVDRAANKELATTASIGWQGFTNLKIGVQKDKRFGLDYYGQQLHFDLSLIHI